MPAKPWYQSRAVWGGIIAALGGVLQAVGLPVDDAGAAVLADTLTAAGTAVGGALAIWGRVRAARPIGR